MCTSHRASLSLGHPRLRGGRSFGFHYLVSEMDSLYCHLQLGNFAHPRNSRRSVDLEHSLVTKCAGIALNVGALRRFMATRRRLIRISTAIQTQGMAWLHRWLDAP